MQRIRHGYRDKVDLLETRVAALEEEKRKLVVCPLRWLHCTVPPLYQLPPRAALFISPSRSCDSAIVKRGMGWLCA